MRRIYVVDEDELICELLSNSLCRQGYDVQTFASSHRALEHVERDRPDLIIADSMLSGLSDVDMVRTLRARLSGIPVILLAIRNSESFEDMAKRTGVNYVFEKPFTEFSELWHAVRREIKRGDSDGTLLGLDKVRLDLLTGLSHELRTPITALKLSMEALFSQLSSILDPGQTRLADISARSVDRIVSLVENQLDLLHMTLGEVTVSRRLVDVEAVVAEAIPVWAGWKAPTHDTRRESVMAFTDPEILRTVIGCLFCGSSPNAACQVAITREVETDRCTIHIVLDFLDGSLQEPTTVRTTASGEVLSLVRKPTAFDFEQRAYDKMIEELGGRIVMQKSADRKEVWITLPAHPVFDHDMDFVRPMERLRKVAALDGHHVSLVRCQADAGHHAIYAVERTSLAHCDYVVRGRTEGVVYLAFVDRREDDVAGALERIQKSWCEQGIDASIAEDSLLEDGVAPHLAGV